MERKLKHVKGKGAFVEEKDQKDQIWEGGREWEEGEREDSIMFHAQKVQNPLGRKQQL